MLEHYDNLELYEGCEQVDEQPKPYTESVYYEAPEGYDTQPGTLSELAALERRLGYPRDFSRSYNAAAARLLDAIFSSGLSYKSKMRRERKALGKA